MAFEGPATPTTYIDSFNPAWPTGQDFRSKGDDHMRYIKEVILNTWQNVTDAILATAAEMNTLVGATSPIQDQLDSLGTRIDDLETSIDTDLKVNLYAPVGTRMVVHQSSAPTGWQNAADYNDAVLRAVSSGAGGSSGSWVISGLTAAEHKLIMNEIPPHNHGGGNHLHGHPRTVQKSSSGYGGYVAGSELDPGDTDYSGTVIQTQGGNEGHAHVISSSGTWRPYSVNVLIISKL